MRPIDAVDILLVSAVLFVLLSWLRNSLPRDVGRRSLAGAPLAGAVYVLSRELELLLLERLFEWLFLAALVAAVVVYQADLRRMLQRAFARRADGPDDDVVGVLVEAAGRLAAGRCGALIAIRGREPWPAHVHGGVAIGGTASVPLLLSLFDPHSAGHDGAVLVEGGEIARFAVHLPLASQTEVSRFGGTRHAAALGLAQECDALVIVVSEERGTISVARNGVLTEVPDAAALLPQLTEFAARPARRADEGSRPPWRHPRAQIAAASLGLALLLWLTFVYSPDTILRRFEVPVAIRNLPENWTVVDPLPETVQIELTGTGPRLSGLDASSLTMALDLSNPTDGVQRVGLSDEALALPAGVELRRVLPASLTLEVRRARTIDAPVAVPTVGMLPSELTLAGIRTVPDSVPLLVPIDGAVPDRVLTEVLDLRRVSDDASFASRLVIPAGSRLTDGASTDVQIEVEVDRRSR